MACYADPFASNGAAAMINKPPDMRAARLYVAQRRAIKQLGYRWLLTPPRPPAAIRIRDARVSFIHVKEK